MNTFYTIGIFAKVQVPEKGYTVTRMEAAYKFTLPEQQEWMDEFKGKVKNTVALKNVKLKNSEQQTKARALKSSYPLEYFMLEGFEADIIIGQRKHEKFVQDMRNVQPP